MSQIIKIEWLKCHHGVEKRSFVPCRDCEKERENYKSLLSRKLLDETPKKIPIKRGCHASKDGGCFCDGSCKEIIGYRDPIYPGEKS